MLNILFPLDVPYHLEINTIDWNMKIILYKKKFAVDKMLGNKLNLYYSVERVLLALFKFTKELKYMEPNLVPVNVCIFIEKK